MGPGAAVGIQFGANAEIGFRVGTRPASEDAAERREYAKGRGTGVGFELLAAVPFELCRALGRVLVLK